jgi:hypothetical protein
VRDVQKVKEDKFKCSEDLFLLPRIESLAANRLFAPPKLRDLTPSSPSSLADRSVFDTAASARSV